jgi:radical SAM superfamily enzyme YgiQ (UPF0313 family)
MRIQIIIPSWHHLADPFLHQPYWEMYLATNLQKKYNTFKISIIDLRKKELSYKTDIDESEIFIFWIFKSADAIECFEIAKHIKKKYPKSYILAGGTHVEVHPQDSINYFDCIVSGPGEIGFSKVIDEIKTSGIKDKHYKIDWLKYPFSEFDYAKREWLPEQDIFNYKLFSEYGRYKSTMTYFSRGCIFKCGFCTLNVPRALQTRSPVLVKNEIEYLKKNYGLEALLLKDEVAIHPNIKISNPIIDAIGGTNIIWRGQTTTQVTLDQLKLAKESGCKELAVGIETVDSFVMKTINKSWQDEKKIIEFINNAKKADIKIKMCLIFGLPGEPENILEKTIEFIEKNQIDYVNVSGFCPLPGSPIYNDYKNYGIEYVDRDWSKHGHLVYRFSEDEDVGLPFEYSKKNKKFKNQFSRDQIVNNIKYLQKWLKDKNKSY